MIEVKTDYKHILVFTHNDLDGILAAFAVKNEYDNNMFNDSWERNVQVILCGYSKKFTLNWFENEVINFSDEIKKKEPNAKMMVMMLDYAIQPNANMVKFVNFLNELGIEYAWCDHHMTAIENLRHYEFNGHQNSRYAGCINTLKYLTGNEDTEIPVLYEMGNDWDMFNKEQTRYSWDNQIIPFSFLITSLGTDINDNEGNLVKTLKKFIESPDTIEKSVSTLGKAISSYNDECCKRNVSNVYERDVTIGNEKYKCLVINSLGDNIFEFQRHPKYNEADLLIRWNFDGEKYIYSFFTNKPDINVGEICEEYFNGGGHRGAAGGSLDKLIF